MALTQYKNPSYYINQGRDGILVESGYAVFTDVDATGDLKLESSRITNASFAWVGAPAADEQVYINESSSTAASRGYVKNPGGNAYTVGRTGSSPTSGLGFFYRIEGV